jgi:hypothetical protein
MFAPRGWLSRSLTREMYRIFQGSEFFDQAWYRRQYLSSLSRWRDPIWHYILRGGASGLAPSRLFDSAYYLEKNDDVRVAKLNPLYHFLAYGQAERRLPLRSANEMVNALFPEAAHLRAFVTPNLDHQRISVLLDSSTPHADYGDLLSSAADLSFTEGASLRVLHRAIKAPLVDIQRALQDKDPRWVAQVEITPVPTTATYSDIPFYAEEITMATSWSSAQALTFTAQENNSWSLSRRVTNAQNQPSPNSPLSPVGLPPDMTLTYNTEAMREELSGEAHSWSPKIHPAALSVAWEAPAADGPWTLGIVGEPESFPWSFSRGIEGLSSWLKSYKGQTDSISLRLLGEQPSPFAFLEEFQPLPATSHDTFHCLLVLSSGEVANLSASAPPAIRIIQVLPASPHRTPPNAAEQEGVLNVCADVSSMVAALDSAHASFLETSQNE